jgi:hypothetical protein
MTPIIRASAALALLAIAGGCAERRLVITSEPAGATVWVNDTELGRTPVSASFLHYGTYDVRLRLEGYEPVVTSARAETPFYEFVGPDLITEAIPTGVVTEIRWNFNLVPALEKSQDRETFERELIQRAKGLAGKVSPPPSEPAPSPAPR